jgi:hypothetical protein
VAVVALTRNSPHALVQVTNDLYYLHHSGESSKSSQRTNRMQQLIHDLILPSQPTSRQCSLPHTALNILPIPPPHTNSSLDEERVTGQLGIGTPQFCPPWTTRTCHPVSPPLDDKTTLQQSNPETYNWNRRSPALVTGWIRALLEYEETNWDETIETTRNMIEDIKRI